MGTESCIFGVLDGGFGLFLKKTSFILSESYVQSIGIGYATVAVACRFNLNYFLELSQKLEFCVSTV